MTRALQACKGSRTFQSAILFSMTRRPNHGQPEWPGSRHFGRPGFGPKITVTSHSRRVAAFHRGDTGDIDEGAKVSDPFWDHHAQVPKLDSVASLWSTISGGPMTMVSMCEKDSRALGIESVVL